MKKVCKKEFFKVFFSIFLKFFVALQEYVGAENEPGMDIQSDAGSEQSLFFTLNIVY